MLASEHCTRALKVYQMFKIAADEDQQIGDKSPVFGRAFAALNKALAFGFSVYQFAGRSVCKPPVRLQQFVRRI